MSQEFRDSLKKAFGEGEPEMIIGQPWFARPVDDERVAFRPARGGIRRGEELVYITNLEPSTGVLGFHYKMRGPSVDERRAILGET